MLLVAGLTGNFCALCRWLCCTQNAQVMKMSLFECGNTSLMTVPSPLREMEFTGSPVQCAAVWHLFGIIVHMAVRLSYHQSTERKSPVTV